MTKEGFLQAGDDIDDPVAVFEQSIHQNGSDYALARKELRRFMFDRAGGPDMTGSIGDALICLSKRSPKDQLAACIVLRSLDVQGLIPEPTATNQIARSIIEICENAIPEILDYVHYDRKAQNYSKFASLESVHGRLLAILAPLAVPYGDLEALMSARKEIFGALNHGILRQYADPFKLRDIKASIEALYSRIKKMIELDTSLLQDVADFNRTVIAVRTEYGDLRSFLINGFLMPFVATCEKLVSSFLLSVRTRFSTSVVWAGNDGHQLQKRYPLHEIERQIQIILPFRNTGPGLATDLKITATSESDAVVIGTSQIILGNVVPGDFVVALDCMVVLACERFSGIVNLEWGEIGNLARQSELFEFEVIAQEKSIDWQALEFDTPYSTEVAVGDQFFARVDKVRLLAGKLIRQVMEPYYITGQRRTGKTSLALAAAQFAKEQCTPGTFEYHDILWGAVAHPYPITSVKQLGDDIESFILSHLPDDFLFPKGDYNGSLSGLIKLSSAALKRSPEKRFLIIIDKFDDIHPELYLQGNLAETFFANLRALSRCKNICLVLVGGENMPFVMDRQGQKLNNFSRFNLSYFSRHSEWNDFELLIRTPTRGVLNWHDDAVSEIFNITNGNPYFAKIVSGGVYRMAVLGRDADVTAEEVTKATEFEVSALGAHSFAHLWQDGVPKPSVEREPDILRRMRVLVALARCIRRGLSPTASHIADNRTSNNLSETEILATLNDFERRDVLTEHSGEYSFTLPIFRLWLVDVGVSQLVADALNEELANAALLSENIAVVRSEEVVSLAKQWPTYRGKHVGTDEIRAWYQQVDNVKDQRILFELLKRTRVLSEAFVRERLRSVHIMLRPSFPEYTIRRKGEVRRDILISYVDGEGKSGANYASMYAEENKIPAECIISTFDFRARVDAHRVKFGPPAVLIIIDDVAATGRSLSKNISSFLEVHKDTLSGVKIRVVTLLATAAARESFSALASQFTSIDLEFRTCEVLAERDYAFPETERVWEGDDEMRARALCENLGVRIYRQAPFGFGGLGLLLVFPTTVPNNSLPILHSYARSGSIKPWQPLFPRVTN